MFEDKDAQCDGCDWRGEQGQLEEHLNECPFVDVNCPKQCGEQLLQKKDLQQHLEKDCFYRKVPCKHCTEDVWWPAMEEHLNECPFVEIFCPDRCGKQLQRIDLQQHLEKDCLFRKVPVQRYAMEVACPNKCGKQLHKNDLPQHLEEYCLLRTVPCKYCTKHVQWNAMEEHLNECPFVDINYPNECGKKLQRKDITLLLTDFDVLEPCGIIYHDQCPFSGIEFNRGGDHICYRVESPSDGIQGDEPHVARLTRQNIYSTTLLKPRAASSASPSEGIHGMTEEHSTEFRRPYTSQREIKLPVTSSRSQQGSRHWLWTAIAVMTGAVVLLTADMETFQRHQLVLGHFKEIKVSLANVTEASRFSSLGSDNEPVTESHCRCIYQQVGGNWRDVLRNLSIAEVTIERLHEDYRGNVAEKFYQGLLAWSRRTQRATTKKLCEALHLAGCSEALEKLSKEVSLANVTEAFRFSSLGSDNEPVTERHCRCIYQQVGGNWKDVLRNLSIAEVTIEKLGKDYCDNVAEKFYQGLLAWSRGTQRATTKKLCEALRLAGCPEALENLSREGVTSDAPAPIPESTVDLGTYV